MTRPLIRSYADCISLMLTARSKAKGKPLASMARLYEDGKSFVLKFYSTPVLRIDPDNTFTFVLDEHVVRSVSPALSQCLDRVTQFRWVRVDTGVYRVINYSDRYKEIKTSPQFFTGLCFDATGNQWLNRRPDLKELVNPNARVVWLRSLRNFRQGLKVRERVGAIPQAYTGFYAPFDTAKFAAAIKEGNFDSFVLGVIASNRQSSDEPVVKTFNRLLGRFSVELRKHFGVFKEE